MIHYVSGIKHSLRMIIQGKFTEGTVYISIRNSALFVDSSLRISIIFTPILQQIKISIMVWIRYIGKPDHCV